MQKRKNKNAKDRIFLGSAALLAIVFISYIPALKADFIWDDDTFLTANPLIHASDGLYKFWFTTEAPDYFPLVSSSLWLEWRLWGPNPHWYHFVNILLHAVSSVILWRILKLLNIPAAFLAAVIFAVHPVNVESVAWITERKNTMPMVFYLLSILFFIKSYDTPRFRFYIASVGLFLLALLSKTSVAMLPLILLGFCWWKNERISKKDILKAIPFFVLSLILSMVTVWFQYNVAIKSEIVRSDSFLTRLATAACAVWFYLYKAIFPFNLIFVYPRWDIDIYQIIYWLPFSSLLAVFFVLWLYRKSWSKPFLFAFGYYVVTLFPVLGFFNIFFMKYSLVADHWQYFAIPAVIAIAVFVGKKICDYFHLTSGLKVTIALISVVLLASQTLRQTRIYDNIESLWRDTIAKNPNCQMAYGNLGIYLAKNDRLDEAFESLQRAFNLLPDTFAYNNLGLAYTKKGDFDKAIPYFRKALELDPNYADAHFNLANVLGIKHNFDLALEHLEIGLKIAPKCANAYYLKGDVLHRKGRLDEAIENYQQAIKLNENDIEANYQLALAFNLKGRQGEAIPFFRRAIQLRPDWPEPLNSLALTLLSRQKENPNNISEALALAQSACSLTKFAQPRFMDTLALAYASVGNFDYAAQIAQKAIELAKNAKNDKLVEAIQNRLELYKTGKLP